MRKVMLTALVMAAEAIMRAHAQDYSLPHYEQKLAKRMEMVTAVDQHGPYHAAWRSLERYRTPAWFRDAKFGIFIHWGVFSVPAFHNEWYSRDMYVRHSLDYIYHRNLYGPQSTFGYKNFIPMFTARKFDPRRWVGLFVKTGAKYIVPVAEHSDGFAMYDSDFTRWDAVHMGPQQDVIGELEKAARTEGLYFGVSSHRAEHWWWFHAGTKYESDVNDPRYRGLYGPAEPMHLPADAGESDEPDPDQLQQWLPPSKAFLEDWLARTTELADKYHPDLIYLDWWVNQPMFQPYLKKLAAYDYDRSLARGQDPVLTYKNYAFPAGSAVYDVERGGLQTIRLRPWQAETSVSINSWGYVQNDTYRTTRSLIQELVDVVSKNGNLLLNVGPKADGIIPAPVKKILLSMGQWLGINGQAIYGTRPWKYFGEGPTHIPTGTKSEQSSLVYTSRDLRFTCKGDTLYIIGMVWPKHRSVLVETLYKGTPYLHTGILGIRLLGTTDTVSWHQDETGLVVQLPAASPMADMPYTLGVTLDGPAHD